jgi:hypothetical protein
MLAHICYTAALTAADKHRTDAKRVLRSTVYTETPLTDFTHL